MIDEAVLRREVGGRAVMRAQLGRLLEMSERSNITLQVIPFNRGVHPGMRRCVLQLKFGQWHPTSSTWRAWPATFFLEPEAEVERLSLVFDHVRAMALSPRDTSAMVAALIAL